MYNLTFNDIDDDVGYFTRETTNVLFLHEEQLSDCTQSVTVNVLFFSPRYLCTGLFFSNLLTVYSFLRKRELNTFASAHLNRLLSQVRCWSKPFLCSVCICVFCVCIKSQLSSFFPEWVSLGRCMHLLLEFLRSWKPQQQWSLNEVCFLSYYQVTAVTNLTAYSIINSQIII